MNDRSFAEFGHPQLQPDAKKIFRQELKPASARVEEAVEFGRAIHEYKTGLSTSVWHESLGKSDNDIVENAKFVVGVIGVRKNMRAGENPQSVDTAIKTSAEKVYSWYAKHYPGAVALLSSYVPHEQQEALRELIGTNVSIG